MRDSLNKQTRVDSQSLARVHKKKIKKQPRTIYYQGQVKRGRVVIKKTNNGTILNLLKGMEQQAYMLWKDRNRELLQEIREMTPEQWAKAID